MLPPLDDADAMAVFADMLSVRGDPRGELAHLHLALEQRPGDPRLVRAAAQHVARHDRHLLGALRTSTSLCDFTWQRGYIVEARLKSLEGQPAWIDRRWVEPPARQKLPRVVRELLRLESAAPLQMLSITIPRSSMGRQLMLACTDELRQARHGLKVLGLFFSDFGGRWGDDESLGATSEDFVRGVHVSADTSIANAVFDRLG